MSTTYVCPVCGYERLNEPAWTNGIASDEICPSCGTHFGYDDAAGGDAGHRQERQRELRAGWKARGCPWFSRSEPQPDGWNPYAQVAVVED